MSAADSRLAAANLVLRELGLGGRVEARGPEGEIATLVLPGLDPSELGGNRGADVAARIRALGFRYVAIDLDPAAPR